MKKFLFFISIVLVSSFSFAGPLSLSDQGFFSAGGVVIQNEGTYDPINAQYDPSGQSMHADHANVFFQIPENANGHAMVFLHGYGQSRMGWMGAADGSDGWNDYFLRKGYSTYLVDQPRRGEAGQSSQSVTLEAAFQDQAWYTQFRMGLLPELNERSQFPQTEEALDQFFRQMTPDTGTIDFALIADAMADIFQRSGKGILVTHSQGGFPGWMTAYLSENVEAVIAIEPGAVPFPLHQMPEPINAGYYTVGGYGVEEEDFEKIISKPIIVVFGDYISKESRVPAEVFWAAELKIAREFEALANERGGDVTVLFLPDVGIYGNSHFMFQEKNNMEIADYLYSWLEERDLV